MKYYIPEDLTAIIPQIINSPAFICDSYSQSQYKTGMKWARTKASDIKQISIKNKFKDIELIGHEVRKYDGFTYKVLVPIKGYGQVLLDMREDVFLESISLLGMRKGKILRGEYKIVIINSQPKLVRYKSKLFFEIADKGYERFCKLKSFDKLRSISKFSNNKEKYKTKVKDIILNTGAGLLDGLHIEDIGLMLGVGNKEQLLLLCDEIVTENSRFYKKETRNKYSRFKYGRKF